MIIAAEVSLGHSLLGGIGGLSLNLDDSVEFVLLVCGSFVGSELLSGMSDRLLLLVCVTGSEELQHLLLEWGESGDFSDHFSDHSASLRNSSLHGDGSVLPGLLGWSGDLVTVVESYEDSCSVVGFTHVLNEALSK